MDNAVDLVQAYLRLNGYFTVSEFSVLEADRRGGTRTATDLDILAFRYAGAGRPVTNARRQVPQLLRFEPDPVLGAASDAADMIVGEVKEGRAQVNEGALHLKVLESALSRFGCCPADTAGQVARQLLAEGEARNAHGHRVRMIAFGSVGESSRRWRVITMGHVVQFLEDYISECWQVLRDVQFKDPGLGVLQLRAKALRALPAANEESSPTRPSGRVDKAERRVSS